MHPAAGLEQPCRRSPRSTARGPLRCPVILILTASTREAAATANA